MIDGKILRRLYWDEGKSLWDIGKMFNLDPSTIRKYMDKQNIPRRPVSRKKSGKFFVCKICGRKFYVNRSRAEKNPPKYCSIKCRGIGSRGRKLKYTNKLKSTQVILRRLRQEVGKCEICGYDDEIRILTIHHKDGNQNNNERSNLLLCCPNCHSLEHLKSGAPSPPIVYFGSKKKFKKKTCAFCGREFTPLTVGRMKSRFCYDCLPGQGHPHTQAIRRRLNKYVAGLISKEEVIDWRKKLDSGENTINKIWNEFKK